MSKPACDEKTFVELFEKYGASEAARRLNMSERIIYRRRNVLEKKLRRSINSPVREHAHRPIVEHPHRATFDIEYGIVLVGSDAHYWPGPATTAHRAFVKFCKDMKPAAVVLNGDVMDFPQISRHPPIGWESQPTVQQEMEAAQERLSEIEKAAFKAHKVWTLGNHDGRFETKLATAAPEFAKIAGVHLKDHFPNWRPAWSCWINDDVVIKHRYKSGAGHNSTLWAGRTMVSGHTHSARVTPFTDYNGTRFDVNTGCLADPDAKAFVDYTEDNPKNWRSAFGVLTFHKGRLLMPELCLVFDKNHIQFRGQVIEV